MSRQYSSRDFFRQMPKALLGRYFAGKGLMSDIDFSTLPEGKPEALFTAWLALSDADRSAAEADFREIHAMSNLKGFNALLDEARWQLEDRPDDLKICIEQLGALDDFHAKAMTAYLSHPQWWRGATRFHYADNLTHWRKRKNLPHHPAAVDAASIDRLARLIGNYFRQTEGRGRHCVVETYRRGNRDYFFAFPEDHAQRSVEWVGSEFDSRPHNPAFEIVFVYTQHEGTLDLNFRGGQKTVAALQDIFAQTILALDELPPDPKDERVYDLAPLARSDFQFVHEPGSGIGPVMVRKLRLSSRVRRGDRLTLEADPTENRLAIYDLLEQIGQAIPLHLYNITLVELGAKVFVSEDKPPKLVTIRITHPNSCSLKYDEIDLGLRQMLEASGIEPRPPASTESTEPVSSAD